jgi:signal transduction histidine kinase/CheY-like chemotaxis protein
MKMWSKKTNTSAISAACAAGQELSRHKLLRQTLYKLASDARTDRVGVWLDAADTERTESSTGPGTAAFRGIVWDRQFQDVPLEWQRLSAEPPLPHEALAAGESVEQRLDHEALPVIGPLLELRRAMWIPVKLRGRLRGILLAGSRRKYGKLPADVLESAASELVLAIELQEEQQLARDRQVDLLLANKTLGSLTGSEKPNLMLAALVDDCIARPRCEGGMTIKFAAIGCLQKERGDSTNLPHTIFRWKNGDPVWINGLGSNPAAAIWGRAMETRRVTSSEASSAPLRSDEVARIVAIPLEAAKKLLGVFVVGFPPAANAPVNLERLELRASLAAASLEAWNRNHEAARQSNSTKENSETTADITFLDTKRTVTVSPYAGLLFKPQTATEGENAGIEHHTRAETELKSILQWLDEGVILFDARDNVRALNLRFLQVAGLDSSDAAELASLDALISKLSPSVSDPWSFAQRWRNLARGIDGGIREELEFLHPSARIVQRLSRPIVDADGRRLGRVEIYRDLTTRRGFQSKLLHTEKLAALGQVISGVAHELNNPLTSILGYSQRLLQKEYTAGSDREVRHIFEEAERATAILRQLLWNAHEAKMEMRTVAINQVVLQAIEVQQASLAQERIRLELDLDPSWPLVHGDAGQLQQVLMNLMENARQALNHTGKSGSIRVRTKQIGDQRVLLEVADDGPGIPEETLGRIFDPFFTTKPAGVGTGLGLAIVLGIVREHGGHVNVACPPNGGAIFSIALRAASSVSRTANPLNNRTAVSSKTWPGSDANPRLAASRTLHHGSRILVVEDEPTVARLIADVLEDEGFHVDVQLDGREALQQADRETYDLVICDMKMPSLDGQHFYQALVQAGNPLSERFLFVTGDVVAQHTRQFLEHHQLPHVAKPFRMEELKNCVRGLLSRDFTGESKTREAGNNG